MPNSTVSTTTVTSTQAGFTATTTIQHQAAPVLIFGLPPELVAVFAFVVFGLVYAFFKFQVKGVPVSLLWIYKNGTAIMLKGQEDLQGVFLTVIKGGKKAETIKKTGLALPVSYVPGKFEAYIETPETNKELAHSISLLKFKGFTVTEKEDKTRRKGFFGKELIKVYLIARESLPVETLAYLNVNLGGLKQARIYGAVEGAGETFDWTGKIQQAGTSDPGNTVLLQEMKSAGKAFFALLAEAMQGTLKNFVLPLVAGAGMGGLMVFLVVELTGHLH